MDELYLACYVVETANHQQVRKSSVSQSSNTAAQSPYIDQFGNFLVAEELKPRVLLDETPLAVVRFSEKTAGLGKYKTFLDKILCKLNFSSDNQDRWCALDNHKFATVIFFLLSKNEVPGAARSKFLSHVYTSDNFNPQFFSSNLSSFLIQPTHRSSDERTRTDAE